jgi:signal transduction histidine kinase/CheY-like chemotaxis protein
MTDADPSIPRSPLIPVAVALFAVLAAVIAIGTGGLRIADLWLDSVQLPFRIITIVIAADAVRTNKHPGAARAGVMLCLGQLFGLVGDASYVAFDLFRMESSATIYLLWGVPYVALHCAGFMELLHSSRSPRERLEDWIDAAVVLTAGCVLGWYFLARQIAQIESTDRTALYLFVFTTAGNIGIVFLAVSARLRGPVGVARAAMNYAVAGFALYAIADLVFEGREFSGTYRPGSWLDLCYAGSTMLLAFAVDAQRRTPEGSPPGAVNNRLFSDSVPLIATSVTLVPLLVEAIRLDVIGNSLAGIAVGLVVLTLLILLRQRLARSEIERLVEARIGLEQQLWQAQKMEAVGRLAGGIAHDFNNILAAISSHAQLLRASQAAGVVSSGEEIEEIEYATQRAAALTRRLLSFSRTDDPADARPTSLADVVRAMQPLISRLLVNDITLSLDIDDENAWVALADGQLEQVLLNLAINARDAMAVGGLLHITTRRVHVHAGDALHERGAAPGEWVAIAVRDNGTGMDAVTRARLFEPFFTTKGPGRGTGLGLSTVSGIVEHGGGHVIVDSAIGTGTTMTVLLPLVAPVVTPVRDAPPARVTTLENDASDARKSSDAPVILVVDDEVSIRRALVRFLTRLEYRVIEAENGAGALDALEQHGWRVDCVLTDIEMPGISGIELATRIRSRDPQLPILYMSGYVSGEYGTDGDIRDDTIMKPFDFAVLIERLREAIGRQRA